MGKTKKYDEERVFFRKKTFSSFSEPPSQKWEGVKYNAGKRQSCLFFNRMQSKNGEFLTSQTGRIGLNGMLEV